MKFYLIGPRFALIFLNYLLNRPQKNWSTFPRFLSKATPILGLIRALAAGGWIYITSSDDHAFHDVAMIVYLVFGLFYMIGMTVLSRWTSPEGKGWSCRLYTIIGFLALVPFMVYWFIQHKVHRIPGGLSLF